MAHRNTEADKDPKALTEALPVALPSCLPKQRRLHWSASEVEQLAALEAELPDESSNVNELLAEQFEARDLRAIATKRGCVRYRKLVQELRAAKMEKTAKSKATVDNRDGEDESEPDTEGEIP